ncbi:uncharacterized protein ACIGJ3_011997 [Trichechus inunguis]
MEKHNLTMLNEFILTGITDRPELQAPLFGLLLIIYMISMVGNLGMIILTKIDSKLQTPMYFFLRHLAITDLGYSTAVGPKMLVNFVVNENTISYYFCATQLAFFIVFIASELFILSAMSYDRYVAICNPLLYTVIMPQRTCWVLVAIPYLYSTFVSLLVTIKIFNLSFCGHNVIRHFYCDNLALLFLLCSNTYEIELIILILSVFELISSLLIVLVSYLLVFVAILRMNSAEGRHKAFSTCGSHLTVVVVFYGTLIFMYMQPKSSHCTDTDKVASIFYTLVIPMLNPLIYSLRNKDVKYALHRTWKKICNVFSTVSSYTKMEKHNLTMLSEFILIGITDHSELQAPLFGLLLIIYVISVVGNLGMIILTKIDFKLQTPMYFFLRHLAITDLGYSTTVGPKMLVNFVVDESKISYYFCAVQLAFLLVFIITELFILSAMSYDRYVAICNPLLYTVIMAQRTCWVLVAIPYVYSTFVSLLITIKIFNLSFCGYNVIRHFYCDSLPLLYLLCSNTNEIELIILILASFDLISSLLTVLVSYLLIIVAILRMKSAESRHKAFSICGSHLTVVVVFYGTLIFMYMQPKSSHSFDTDKVASIFYTLVIPMLNPLIYSLRNKDVKYALHRTWKKICKIFSTV